MIKWIRSYLTLQLSWIGHRTFVQGKIKKYLAYKSFIIKDHYDSLLKNMTFNEQTMALIHYRTNLFYILMGHKLWGIKELISIDKKNKICFILESWNKSDC